MADFNHEKGFIKITDGCIEFFSVSGVKKYTMRVKDFQFDKDCIHAMMSEMSRWIYQYRDGVKVVGVSHDNIENYMLRQIITGMMEEINPEFGARLNRIIEEKLMKGGFLDGIVAKKEMGLLFYDAFKELK
jgi:hypothetical protein